jgi:hypothetical protein
MGLTVIEFHDKMSQNYVSKIIEIAELSHKG